MMMWAGPHISGVSQCNIMLSLEYCDELKLYTMPADDLASSMTTIIKSKKLM